MKKLNQIDVSLETHRLKRAYGSKVFKALERARKVLWDLHCLRTESPCPTEREAAKIAHCEFLEAIHEVQDKAL